MSRSRISPFRALPGNLLANFGLKERFFFQSSGPDPRATKTSTAEYALGKDSDWTADKHDLEIRCEIANANELAVLFGDDGIAVDSATMLLALEWTSADCAHRLIGPVLELTKAGLTASTSGVVLSLTLSAGSVRGVGTIAVQLFLGHAGSPARAGAGMAQTRGFRFGAPGMPIKIYIDGDGSLFPILEERCGPDAALWEFRDSWSDPLEDEFSSAYVALVLNKDHPDFPRLRDARAGTDKMSPLMKQVIAAWVALLINEVRMRTGSDFAGIVSGDSRAAMPGSIADTAGDLVRSGELVTDSLSALMTSCQRWIDRVTVACEMQE